MSVRSPTADVLEVLSRYAAGYFPLYDPFGRFYWERLSIRAFIPINDQTLARARQVGQRKKNTFELRYTTAVDEVIQHLRAEQVKPNSWVREHVVAIYKALHAAGLLQTIEAYDRKTGQLAGGLLGLVLPGTFIAETMFSFVPDASKQCLCRLIEDSHEAGFEMIDVQTPHDLDEFGQTKKEPGRTAHPCIRLGEQHATIAVFMRLLQTVWKKTFQGGAKEWLEVSRAIQAGDSDDDTATRLGLSVEGMQGVRRIINRPIIKTKHGDTNRTGTRAEN
jgi:leucyl/phenylalanyl-tRNA--protein transferase